VPTSVTEAAPGVPELDARALTTGYARTPIVHAVDVSVALGEIVAVIGPNGAGKSTLLKAIAGALPVMSGEVWLCGEIITNESSDHRARLGLGYVPQVNDVFFAMTVTENLEMGGYTLPRREVAGRINEVFELIPMLQPLATRLASKLSGGERKLLAFGRALMMRPTFLLLDEPTANLSPDLAKTMLREHVARLAAHGVGILLVEQRASEALEIASRAYVLVSGRISMSGNASEIGSSDDIGALFLGRPSATRVAEPTPESVP
jgi:branched-chain amino acid transport system ATP-binding protein